MGAGHGSGKSLHGDFDMHAGEYGDDQGDNDNNNSYGSYEEEEY
jgi:hypothetical protein